MAQTILYTLTSVVIVSLISFIGVVSLVIKKNRLNALLLVLVSLSAGTLFAGSFLHLLPETVEKSGFTLPVGLSVIAGIIIFFILEKIIHLRRCEIPHQHTYPLLHEPHKHHIGIMNVLGDGLHNFIDGLVIAGAYFVSLPAGVATTVAVILHEVPQELADFGVLLYAGFSRGKALFYNFLSAAIAIIGAVVGLIIGTSSEKFILFLLPFAAGGFIYIAGSNLIPELHRECSLKESIWHFAAMLLGIVLMMLLLLLE